MRYYISQYLEGAQDYSQASIKIVNKGWLYRIVTIQSDLYQISDGIEPPFIIHEKMMSQLFSLLRKDATSAYDDAMSIVK